MCHRTASPIPFPLTLIFHMFRWQGDDFFHDFISLFSHCETKQGSSTQYLALIHRRVQFFSKSVTEDKKHPPIQFFPTQVIVFYHHQSAQGIHAMWPGGKIPAPWANTTEPGKLIQVRMIQILAVIAISIRLVYFYEVDISIIVKKKIP